VLAWLAAAGLGVAASARLYLFAVLPTLILCWLLANVSQGLAAFGSGLSDLGVSLATGQLGALPLAVLLGLLTWLTVLGWGPSLPARFKKKPATEPRPAAVEPPQPAQPEQSSQPPRPKPTKPPTNPPLFRLIAEHRVRALHPAGLRTNRDYREPPSTAVAALEEANVVFIFEPWAFLQTDDGREGWAEWRLAT